MFQQYHAALDTLKRYILCISAIFNFLQMSKIRSLHIINDLYRITFSLTQSFRNKITDNNPTTKK